MTPSIMDPQTLDQIVMINERQQSGRVMEVEDQGRPYSDVVLTISARDIKDVDTDSYTDPFCIVSEASAGLVRCRTWKEIGRTEVINNCLNPDWATKIRIAYFFEEQQRILFELFDKGPGKEKTQIGSASLLLHEILGSKCNRKTVKLFKDGKNYGTITVTAEEMSKGRQESVYFVCSATKLDRKDFLGKCDPFLKISRINKDKTYQLAYRTRYHEQNLNPKWKPFEIHIDQLCYGDKDREFLVECFDWDKDGNHDLVGNCRTTVNRLLNKEDVTLPLINQKKMKKNKKYVDSGQLHFHRVYCWMDYTFLDFITGGTELEFTVAIDFTKSNLPSGNMASLHHVDDESASQYEIAIQAIAEICQYYNNSQLFYAYGFGARLPGDNRVNFHFPLNLTTNSPECIGMDGLLNAYRDALNRIELAGPTEFGPTLRHAARHAASLPPDGSRYSVLLIITDGVINDMNRAKEEIVKASSLPLSIIIVGVGYDSFGEMKVLDSDRQMLQVNGKYAKRDIVQFVQLREFLPPHRILTDDDLIEAKYRLAKEVLQEVPAQLTSYMKSKGIFPKQICPVSCDDDRKLSVIERGYPNIQTTSRTRRRMLPAVPCEEVQNMHINPTRSA
uniref:Copine family protein n=2 Tax=Wuchereria bancrofti TaxID=6293 RepID=A0AAF5Q3Q2_WUCBA